MGDVPTYRWGLELFRCSNTSSLVAGFLGDWSEPDRHISCVHRKSHRSWTHAKRADVRVRKRISPPVLPLPCATNRIPPATLGHPPVTFRMVSEISSIGT